MSMKRIIRFGIFCTGFAILAVFFACQGTPEPVIEDDVWTFLKRGDERALGFFPRQVSVNAREDSTGRTPLHYAAELNNTDFAAFFIALGADVDAQDGDGQTPLGICAGAGRADVAKLLVQKGANIHKPAKGGQSPAKMALQQRGGFLPALLSTYAACNSTDSDGKTILHLATEQGNIGTIKTILGIIDSFNGTSTALVAAGNRNNPIDVRDSKGQNPLDIALSHPDSRDYMEIAELLILAGSISDNPIYYYFGPAVKNANYDLRRGDGLAPLHYAAKEGHEGLMVFLLEKKANVNIKNTSGATPLHDAARSGNIKVITLLLKNGADVNAQDAKENTPLHIAVPPGNHAEVIKLFLDNRANPNLRDEHGDTPVHALITMNRNAETVQTLLASDVDLSIRNIKGQTPLHLAVQENRITLISLLLSKGCDIFAADNAGVTPFDKALDVKGPILDALITPATAQQHDSAGNTLLHAAVKKYATPTIIGKIIGNNVSINARNREGDTALHIAARTNQKDTGEQILAKGDADIFSFNSAEESPLKIALTHSSGRLQWMFTPQTTGSRDGLGNSMLHYVAQWKYDNHIDFIIEKGIHTETRNAIGETPLFFAAKFDGTSTIRTLIASGADRDARDSLGNTSLHSAVRWNAKNSVITLVERGIDVNAHNLNGTTALHESVSLGLTDIAVILLSNRADIEVRDNGGNTPFMAAVKSGQLGSVELLSRYNANAMTRNTNGDTPLHFAVLGQDRPMIRFLLGKNASIHARNTRNRTPFQVALTDSPGVIGSLIAGDRNRINNPDDFGNTPLHVALQEKVSANVLKVLIDLGASLNGVDSNGRIPLRLAVDMNAWEQAKLLADAGSDPFSVAVDSKTPGEIAIARGNDMIRAIFSGVAIRKTDSLGNTALHYAARMGKPEAISVLLDLGADKSTKNISAESPADVAMRWNNRENAMLLN